MATLVPVSIGRWLGIPGPASDADPVEPMAPGDRPPNAAWHPELAMAIRRDRDAEAPYVAYADWLEPNNDPRAAAIRGDSAVLERFPGHFLGPLAFADGVAVTWRRGFWESLRIERDADVDGVARLLADALAHPSAFVLDRLEVHADCIAEVAEVLADGDVLPIRTLVVDARGGPLGAWAAVWARVPELRRLSMVGDYVALGDIDLPELVELAIDGTIPPDSQESLVRMATPRIREIRVAVTDDVARRIDVRFPGTRRG